MIKTMYKIICWALSLVLFVACQPQTQKAKHLGEDKQLDSIMMAQLELNTHFAEAADYDCSAFVQSDSLEYAMDDSGFWYTKTIVTSNDTIQRGQEVSLHLQISELRGALL